MIKIKGQVDTKGAIRQLELSGHAGAGEYGVDIVCAAVSSQVISVENSLERLVGLPYDVQVDEVAGGYLKLTVPACSNKQQEHDAQVLLRHLVYALEVLADNYPEFIHLKINQAK